MAKEDLLKQALQNRNRNGAEAKQNRKSAVETIATGEDTKPDFKKLAEKLEAEKEERVGENVGFTKDTIYIRDDLYAAMQALCDKMGDKKKHVNAAYELYLEKIYKERM